jgi:hypothetical protein
MRMAKKPMVPTPRREVPVRETRSGTRGRAIQVLVGIFIGGAFVVGVAALILKSGSSASSPSLRDLVENVDPGPIHVHGLGINPEDGSLLIATHTGLWRTVVGETQAKRVTNQMQDTMGFTIIGPNRFLGSGHPDQVQARDKGLPPLLGLIESTDAGKSWQTISLLGEADFHVLRSKGTRVYGFDATNERLLFSRDAGRTWTERTPPASLVDMAVNPSNLSHLIASGERGLWESANEGREWKPSGEDSGLLAWPVPGRLYLITADGEVRLSPNGGKRWDAVGDIGGQPAALLAQTARELYVALHDGTVKRSPDGGRTWQVRSRP